MSMDMLGVVLGVAIGFVLGLLEDAVAGVERLARLVRDIWRMWRHGLGA